MHVGFPKTESLSGIRVSEKQRGDYGAAVRRIEPRGGIRDKLLNRGGGFRNRIGSKLSRAHFVRQQKPGNSAEKISTFRVNGFQCQRARLITGAQKGAGNQDIGLQPGSDAQLCRRVTAHPEVECHFARDPFPLSPFHPFDEIESCGGDARGVHQTHRPLLGPVEIPFRFQIKERHPQGTRVIGTGRVGERSEHRHSHSPQENRPCNQAWERNAAEALVQGVHFTNRLGSCRGDARMNKTGISRHHRDCDVPQASILCRVGRKHSLRMIHAAQGTPSIPRNELREDCGGSDRDGTALMAGFYFLMISAGARSAWSRAVIFFIPDSEARKNFLNPAQR